MRAYLHPEARPMIEMNMTPLIDVLLVLLIMFIITIPLQSHAVKVDLPKGPTVIVNPIRNTLMISAGGGLAWNGATVSDDQLRAALVASQAMEPIPELHLKPEAQARYERVDQVLAMTKRANVAR